MIVVPESGEINIASGTPGADYIIEGIGDAVIRIGNAIDADGNVLIAAGSTYQVDNDFEGTVIVNLDGAICDSVDINTITTTGIIASALPQSLSELERDFQFYFDFYVNAGAGEDQIQGSSCKDFIRAGAGDDVVTLGQGDDINYYTVDQLQGNLKETDICIDFDSNGDDKIQIDADLEGLIKIEGFGTNKIIIILSGAQSGTTEFVSRGETIDDDDVQFVF